MELEKLKTESELNKLPIKQVGIEPMLLIGSIALIIVYYFVFQRQGFTYLHQDLFLISIEASHCSLPCFATAHHANMRCHDCQFLHPELGPHIIRKLAHVHDAGEESFDAPNKSIFHLPACYIKKR